MFIACECYGGSDEDVCIFDTSDCSAERFSIKEITPYIRDFDIHNLVYDTKVKKYLLSYMLLLRAGYLDNKNEFVYAEELYSDVYVLTIQGWGKLTIDLSKRGLYVNNTCITRANLADVSYLFLYKDCVVLRCLYIDFIRKYNNYFTVIVDRSGKIDYYEADFSKVTDMKLATMIDTTCKV